MSTIRLSESIAAIIRCFFLFSLWTGISIPSSVIAQTNIQIHDSLLLDFNSNSPVVWNFNNELVIGANYLGSNMPAGWHIVGTGDFDGNGLTDILWSTVAPGGSAYLWLTTSAGPAGISLAQYGSVPGKAWVGDFNGDGKSDILWDMGSEAPVLWTMNGATVTSNRVFGSNMPAGWHIVGVGDFYGNGLTDILWSTITPGGPAYMWMMTSTGPVGVSLAQYGPVPGKAWIGDFNGDGKSDILWDRGSNSPVLWTMNGATVTSNRVLGTNMPVGWHIVGTGDFDGNGLTDIVWSTMAPGGPVYMWTMTQYGPIGSNPLQGAKIAGKVWSGVFNTPASIINPSGPGILQGLKLDQNLQPFSTANYPGATLSLRSYSGLAVIPNSGYQQTFGPSMTTYQANLAAGSYEVGMNVPDGYQAYYSLCNNCTNHPDSSYQTYGDYNSSPLVVTIVAGQTADLDWKFVQTPNVEIPVQTPTTYQTLSPSDSAYDLQNLGQALTCNLPGVPNPLPATDTQLFKGSKAWVSTGINRNVGGVGVSMTLINPGAPDFGLQIVDSRSSGGAAWQTTASIVSPQLVNGMHPIAHYNQSAGNSAEVWGYGGNVTNDPVAGIAETNFLPLFSNDIETAIGTGISAQYSPCYHSGVRFGNGMTSILPSNTSVSVAGNSESVLTLRSTYAARALGIQNWYNGSSDDQAIYMLRHAARTGNLKLYFLASDNTTLLGPIVPYEPFPIPPFPVADVFVDNCPSDPAQACFIKTLPTSLAVLEWTVAGEDIAMAIHATSQFFGNAQQGEFTGVINLRQTGTCSDITNDSCGNVQWHTTFPQSGSGTFQTGQGIDEIVSYDFGTPAAISAMYGINLPP